MNKAVSTFKSANSQVQANPVGALKSLLFLALAILIIFALIKFLKGLSGATQLVSEALPTTESTKQDVLTSTNYTDPLKWLNGTTGAAAIGKSSYKTISNYLNAKNISWDLINKNADIIWNAKKPFYIDSTEVQNAIAQMPSKAAISLLALSFDNKYSKLWNGAPLLSFLTKYMKVSEMQTVAKIINSKKDL